MPVSEKQRQQARINGAKSKGPITLEGKLISRRNALKHGLTGAGVVLTQEIENDYLTELDVFNNTFHPQTPYEDRLVQQAAVTSVRKKHLFRVEIERKKQRVRHAERDQDETREDLVFDLARLLYSEDDPFDAWRQLRRTAEGCDYLHDRWDELKTILQTRGVWNDDQLDQVTRLLGFNARTLATPHPTIELLLHLVKAVRYHQDPENSPLSAKYSKERLVEHFGTREEARNNLIAFVDRQMDELAKRGEKLWETYDKPDRDAAAELALFDPGPEMARLIRYANDADRLERRALAELERHRRLREQEQATPIRPEAQNEPRPATNGIATPPATNAQTAYGYKFTSLVNASRTTTDSTTSAPVATPAPAPATFATAPTQVQQPPAAPDDPGEPAS